MRPPICLPFLLKIQPKTFLTKKFARRFVIGGNVIIRTTDRYLQAKARACRNSFASQPSAPTREIMMRKTILTIVGSALLAASTVQIAAAEHHKVRRVDRAPAPVSEPFRDSNAYLSPSPWAQPGWSRYQNGAMSAPAGH